MTGMTVAGWVERERTALRISRAAPAVAAVLGVAAVVETVARQAHGALASYVVALSLLGLATTVPLAVGRSVAGVAISTAVMTAAGVLSLAAFDMLTLAGIAAQLAAAYWHLGRQWSSPLAVLFGVPYLVLALLDGPDAPVIAYLLAALIPVAAGVGIAVRLRDRDAAARAVRDEFDDTRLEHMAQAERARIARELHDVVAHHISMISVQAESARLTVPDMPAAGGRRLSAIGDTARAALTEMRRLLGVLRDDTEDGQGTPAELRPQPGLRQLNDLLDEARDATGSGTRLILSGRPASLDPGVELAAYRIVQEALTNCRRHAPGAAVDVTLEYRPTELRVLIRDDGPGDSGACGDTGPAGHGLLGMRERAAAVGGRLRSGPSRSGGFLVEAVLPAGQRHLL
jgi:signal transduction histidine kinase